MPDAPPRALHDPVLCLARGLFGSLTRGSRDVPWTVDYDHGRDSYRFDGPALLGCDDLRVLQGVVALANGSREVVGAGSSRGALKLRGGLQLAGDVESDEVLLLRTSLASLACAAGYSTSRGGAMGRHLRASLGRLASVSVLRFPGGGGREGWRLLAWDEAGVGRERLRIVLNPRLGLCSQGFKRFVQIDMDEARALEGDVARLVHQRLCAWINSSESKLVRRDTLMDYPSWTAEANPAAVRQRRSSLAAAIDELECAGWKFEKRPRLIFEIRRPPGATARSAPSRDAAGRSGRTPSSGSQREAARIRVPSVGGRERRTPAAPA